MYIEFEPENGSQQGIEIPDADSFYYQKTNSSSLVLKWTRFNNSPELTIIVDVHLLKDERMAVPCLMGELAENPEELFSSEKNSKKTFEYPGFLGIWNLRFGN